MEKSLLTPYREEAERYYEGPEYAELVEELHACIESIREKLQNKKLALDLEGVLVSGSFPDNKFDGQAIPPTDRLRRPLAQELLDRLSTVTEVIIWTAAYKHFPAAMITSSGLFVPHQVEIVDRTRYISESGSLLLSWTSRRWKKDCCSFRF